MYRNNNNNNFFRCVVHCFAMVTVCAFVCIRKDIEFKIVKINYAIERINSAFSSVLL